MRGVAIKHSELLCTMVPQFQRHLTVRDAWARNAVSFLLDVLWIWCFKINKGKMAQEREQKTSKNNMYELNRIKEKETGRKGGRSKVACLSFFFLRNFWTKHENTSGWFLCVQTNGQQPLSKYRQLPIVSQIGKAHPIWWLRKRLFQLIWTTIGSKQKKGKGSPMNFTADQKTLSLECWEKIDSM